MSLSDDQIRKLLGMIASSEEDDLDCGNCFEHLAEFAEAELASLEVPEALQVVQKHLDQCPCCRAEYNALLDGLRALEE